MNPISYSSIQKVLQYQTSRGQIPFREWFLSLKDVQARARIRARLDRLIQGNLGDSKNLGGGITNYVSILARDIVFILAERTRRLLFCFGEEKKAVREKT